MRWPTWWPFRRPCRRQMLSESAKRDAHAELWRVQQRWPEVRERAESLRRGRERNGFGEAMLQLFRDSEH